MHYMDLGRTGLRVSRICLGTMTFGEQNTTEEGFAQMDMALERGVNFFDTAEMYSFPSSPETQGDSERVIGDWMTARKNRDQIIVASKIIGPGDGFRHVRDNDHSFGAKQIDDAVGQSLKRLKTDYIDLYQLHWPERTTNTFATLGYSHEENESWTAFDEVLSSLAKHVKAGTIRAIGCSNETPWGLMRMLSMADHAGLPRMASIQNQYNLLNRAFEVGLAEVAIREDCGLLAYSPMAFGLLSGKYLGGARPEKSRLALYPDYDRYTSPPAVAAIQAYANLARDHGLDPAQMSLAFVNSRRFVTSNIIGATTLAQLESNIASDDLTLSDEVLKAIDDIHDAAPNPPQ
ncbi:MAG: aldo/keto reductase [Rhodospirillales bacterium]|jgi:aryl-alcohol dehydrogenase-like predicted oxidoreductase|nr:aldo/keto reductase [Rhodospirillales bacterium]MBT4040867.1 aldo/keto reductase [Rhodospirillales bacterium]MBT4627653.1 aldo/keto reductase [Rhodospirillales bacterium]MBT5351956.1 aldo/keto reductase [Rhodospirillales bacterium]MBT5521131.1 aldo/keto reductase [Rhodospirillales bacterium]